MVLYYPDGLPVSLFYKFYDNVLLHGSLLLLIAVKKMLTFNGAEVPICTLITSIDCYPNDGLPWMTEKYQCFYSTIIPTNPNTKSSLISREINLHLELSALLRLYQRYQNRTGILWISSLICVWLGSYENTIFVLYSCGLLLWYLQTCKPLYPVDASSDVFSEFPELTFHSKSTLVLLEPDQDVPFT